MGKFITMMDFSTPVFSGYEDEIDDIRDMDGFNERLDMLDRADNFLKAIKSKTNSKDKKKIKYLRKEVLARYCIPGKATGYLIDIDSMFYRKPTSKDKTITVSLKVSDGEMALNKILVDCLGQTIEKHEAKIKKE